MVTNFSSLDTDWPCHFPMTHWAFWHPISHRWPRMTPPWICQSIADLRLKIQNYETTFFSDPSRSSLSQFLRWLHLWHGNFPNKKHMRPRPYGHQSMRDPALKITNYETIFFSDPSWSSLSPFLEWDKNSLGQLAIKSLNLHGCHIWWKWGHYGGNGPQVGNWAKFGAQCQNV